MELAIPGTAGVMNALAAAAVGVGLALEHDKIIEGLAALSPVDGRGKTLHLGRGIRLVDDSYNASPSSVTAAISVLATTPAPEPRFLVTC